MSRLEIRLAGSGGQGIVLSSIILAEAALLAGKYVAQTQSYGPEARGGLCRAELVVDVLPIGYPRVVSADMLLALTQESLDAFGTDTREGAQIAIDRSLAQPAELSGRIVVALPILDTARTTVGRPMTANIVAVGAINALLGIAPDDVLERAVRMHVPKGTEDINLLALAEGRRLGESAL